MMKKKNYNSIGIYDKTNNLVDYIEFEDCGEDLKCYFSVSGDSLKSKYVHDYKDDKPFQTVNSTVQYNDNIMLSQFTLDGETVMKAIPSGETLASINKLSVSSRVDTYDNTETNDTSVQYFTIKHDLIDDWVNKL